MSGSNQTNENLAASQLAFAVGSLQLNLEVPEGVWNPTPNGILLAEVLESMNFSGESILELGTGCGLHAIILGLRGARELLLTERLRATRTEKSTFARKIGKTRRGEEFLDLANLLCYTSKIKKYFLMLCKHKS